MTVAWLNGINLHVETTSLLINMHVASSTFTENSVVSMYTK